MLRILASYKLERSSVLLGGKKARNVLGGVNHMNDDIKGEKLTVSGRVAGMHRTQYIFTEHSVSTSLVWLKCISWVQAEKCITLENLI